MLCVYLQFSWNREFSINRASMLLRELFDLNQWYRIGDHGLSSKHIHIKYIFVSLLLFFSLSSYFSLAAVAWIFFFLTFMHGSSMAITSKNIIQWHYPWQSIHIFFSRFVFAFSLCLGNIFTFVSLLTLWQYLRKSKNNLFYFGFLFHELCLKSNGYEIWID